MCVSVTDGGSTLTQLCFKASYQYRQHAGTEKHFGLRYSMKFKFHPHEVVSRYRDPDKSTKPSSVSIIKDDILKIITF